LVAADEWLDMKKATLAPRSVKIELANLAHLLPELGRKLICDIEAREIARYQQKRLGEKASPKTVNLEVGTLRAILKRSGQWARLQPEVKLLPTRDDVGRAITPQEEKALLQACAQSRSRSLVPFVTLAIETGARYGVIRTLQWGSVDLENRCLKWGKDKTASGTGRIVPLSQRAVAAISFWATHFPKRKQEHYVFPTERYGAGGGTNSAPRLTTLIQQSPSGTSRKHGRQPDFGQRGF
jgi:integrase